MSALSFRCDAKALAAALKVVSAVVERRNTIPVLSCVQIAAIADCETAVRLSATNLDAWISLDVPADVFNPGAVNVDASAFLDGIKAAAKAKGAQVEAVTDAETSRLNVITGRSRLTYPIDGNELPPLPAWETLETTERADVMAHGADGLDLCGDKVLAKLAKHCGDASAICDYRLDSDGKADRYRVEFPGAVYVGKLESAAFNYKPQRRDPYSYGHDADAERQALSYLRTMRRAHGLDVIGDNDGRLIVHNGRAVGLAMGEGKRDYPESRAMPDGWEPPAGTEFEPVEYCAGATQCHVDGQRISRMYDGGPWTMSYQPSPETAGQVIYPEGAYSLPMPADQRRAIATLTVDVGDDTIPLRAKFDGSGASTCIELDAAAVAELCGPVDPSTFVEIEARAWHHGRVIARGADADRFHAMRDAFDRNARKALKCCKSTADKFLTASNIGAAWAEKVAAFVDGLEPVETAPAVPETAPEICAEICADPFDGFTDASDFVDAPEPAAPSNIVQFKPAGPGFHIAVIEPTPAPVEPVEEARADPEPAAHDVPAPVEAPATTPGAPMPSEALERRLARLEAALGLVDQPKRTPAHAAAIRRAWAMRRQMREAAKVHALAIASGKAALVESRHNVERLLERVERAESFAKERAELVAAIDAERARVADLGGRLNRRLDDVERLERAKGRTVRHAAALRRDLARTRAQRDGLAANVAALSSRIARDAATLDRLQPSAGDQPRIILATR